jgi:hypothetical protein
MAKRNCGYQGGLGGDESGIGGWRPEQDLRRTFQQICEGLKNAGHSWEKTPVEVYEPEKTLQLLDVCRRWAVLDGGDMLGKGGDAGLIYHMT